MNFEAAFERFPRFLKYERFMLHHLSKHPTDYIGAFRTLPRRLRKLFVQGYQSYLFNKFLSARMEKMIPLNEPQIGDYMLRLDENGFPTEEKEKATKTNIHAMEQLVKEGKMCVALPLVGPSLAPSDGLQGEIEQAILEIENVDPNKFKIPSMPEATAEGRVRAILNPVANLVQESISEDLENNEKWMIKLAFSLNRGSYATVVLREFMKPKDVIIAGY